MATTWPSTLPQILQQDDAQHTAPDLLYVAPADAGMMPGTRQRATANYEELQGSMSMTTTQIIIFRALWISDCASLITFPNPYGAGTITVKFLARPTWKPTGGGNFLVSLKFGILP